MGLSEAVGVSPLSDAKGYVMVESTGHARSRGCLRPLLVVLVVAVVLLVFLRVSGCGAALLFPPIAGQNCGEASSGDPTVSYDPGKGELCLWQAYIRCRTATLVFDSRNVDVGISHAITVQPATTGCEITDSVQAYSAGHLFESRSSVTTYHCTRLQQQSGGLLLTGCGAEGSIDLPPSERPVQLGHLCGIISNNMRAISAGPTGSAPATVAAIENCFLKAYTNCTQPATLVYGTLDGSPNFPTPASTPNYGVIPLHTLVVWQPFGTCLLTDAVRSGPGPIALSYFDCTGMVPVQGSGLVLRGCGSEGDIMLPSGTPANR